MLIDCDSCTARPRACGDCIVTHLLSAQPRADLSDGEIAAVQVLSAGGLVPPLRLVTTSEPTVRTRQPRSGSTGRGVGSGAQAG